MTPDGVVSMILNSIGYTGQRVLTKTIMEPSFGDGAFLINIVQRIITEGKKAGLTEPDIGSIINNKVYGIEKDENLYNRALERLNSLLDVYGVKNVTWNNLICGDTLTAYKTFENRFDYVVDNPPLSLKELVSTGKDIITILRNNIFTHMNINSVCALGGVV